MKLKHSDNKYDKNTINVCFRLHEKASRNCSRTAKRREIKEMKKRRHNLRKVLLTLDYIVEFVGSVFCGFVYFVGDRLILQHILLTVGSLIYGIAIPLTHLLNETRVRDVILNQGWIQGFKSIFYSSKKIKQIDRKKTLNTLHSERFPLPSDLNIPVPFIQMTDDLLKKKSSIECCSDKAKGLIQLPNSPHNTSKKYTSNKFRCASIDVSHSSQKSCTSEKPAKYNDLNLIETVHCSVHPILIGANGEIHESKTFSNDPAKK